MPETTNIAATQTPASAVGVSLSPANAGELTRRWIEKANIGQESAGTYTRCVRQFVLWLSKRDIDNPGEKDILDYRKYLEAEKKKPATVQLYIIAIRQFFRWLAKEGIYENIVERIKVTAVGREHETDHLTPDQIKSVLSRIDRRTECGLRDYAMLSLMAASGLKIIEVCRVNIEDLRITDGGARLYLQSGRKDGAGVFADIPAQVEDAIRAYLAVREHQPSDPLFTGLSNSNRCGRLSTRSVYAIAKSRMRDAGFDSKKLTAHSFRHTAIKLAALGGQSIEDIRRFARHDSIATTMLYVRDAERKKNNCAETVAAAIL